MTPTAHSHPLFTLRTHSLAGREPELTQLRQIVDTLSHTTEHTLLAYITGDGGMGKTRLLEWLRDDCRSNPHLLCTDVLDFYNSLLRTDIDLVDQIFERLRDELEAKGLLGHFAPFMALLERFRRQELAAAGSDIRQDVIRAFVAAWQPLLEQNYRMVVLLDTAELLRFVDDPIRQRFAGPLPEASSLGWLNEVVCDDSQLPGVLFVVAGRKAEAGPIYHELRKLAAQGAANPTERLIELAGLSRAGVDEYIEILAATLEQTDQAHHAEQLRHELSEAQRTAFFLLTEGSPIALAIVLQLYIAGDTPEVPRLLAEQMADLTQVLPGAQQRLWQALALALAEFQTFGAVSNIIGYMALAQKGLTPARLAALVGQGDAAEYVDLFKELEQQIFVKRLPNGSLVLHDKVQEWAEYGLYGKPNEHTRSIYQRLADSCNREIEAVEAEIANRLLHADPIMSDIEDPEEIPAPKPRLTGEFEDPLPTDAEVEPTARLLQFRRLRRTRRNLVIDRMTYALRADPLQGYRQYYELAEEAFNVGRMDYEAQIRSEFLDWWDKVDHRDNDYKHRAHAYAMGLTQAIIDGDFALRSVQRAYNHALTDTNRTQGLTDTIALVERILTPPDQKPFRIPTYVAILLGIYHDMAAGQLAIHEGELQAVHQSFDRRIRQLNRLDRQQAKTRSPEPLAPFLINSALAFAYYELGFFESAQGNHGAAIRSYTASLLPYRALNFEINTARSLNDKAYSLAMVGDSNSADMAVRDALRLRRKLGFSYPIGLSYNTYCIVLTMSERPTAALVHGTYALSIFQSIGHDFGQLLAHRALSEACRRNAERFPFDLVKQRGFLRQAQEHSARALELATTMLTPNDALMIEVMDEYGCVWRDLASYCWRNPDFCRDDLQNAGQRSLETLTQAIDQVRDKPKARLQLVDSMINLAYLRYYELFAANADKRTVLTAAQTALEAALAHVPAEIREPSSPNHPSHTLTVYWAHLSKAHSLLIRIAREQIRLLPLEEQAPDRPTGPLHPLEEELLRHCAYTLYFRSLLYENVRNVRTSNQAIYEAMQAFHAPVLMRFYAAANAISADIGLPVKKRSLLQKYLAENFGVAELATRRLLP